MLTEKEQIGVKVVVLGEPAVGKTALRINYTGEQMEGDFSMTMGADIIDSRIELPEAIVDVQIFDVAGQESYDAITRKFMKDSQGAIVVFDLTRPDTFEKTINWLEKLHEENPHMESNIPFILVGNKADLVKFIDESIYQEVQERVEFFNRHKNYSQTPTTFITTSAVTGESVKNAFYHLARTIYINFQLEDGEITEEQAQEALSEVLVIEDIKSTTDKVTGQVIIPDEKVDMDDLSREIADRQRVLEEQRLREIEEEEKRKEERERLRKKKGFWG